MINPSNIGGWGCGVDCPPAGKAYKTICEAMTQDPDIVKFYFVPFWHELGCGWDFFVEVKDGVDPGQKSRFYFEEFLE